MKREMVASRVKKTDVAFSPPLAYNLCWQPSQREAGMRQTIDLVLLILTGVLGAGAATAAPR